MKLANPIYVLHILGTLIQEVLVNKKEMECSKWNNQKTLYVPVPFRDFSEAIETCDKFLPKSMADHFQVIGFYFSQ